MPVVLRHRLRLVLPSLYRDGNLRRLLCGGSGASSGLLCSSSASRRGLRLLLLHTSLRRRSCSSCSHAGRRRRRVGLLSPHSRSGRLRPCQRRLELGFLRCDATPQDLHLGVYRAPLGILARHLLRRGKTR